MEVKHNLRLVQILCPFLLVGDDVSMVTPDTPFSKSSRLQALPSRQHSCLAFFSRVWDCLNPDIGLPSAGVEPNASAAPIVQSNRREEPILRRDVAAVGRVRWAHWPMPIKTPLGSVAYPPAMVVPTRATFETISAQPGLFRGSKVTPPTGFAVISQTGREPAWLAADFPCPR